MHERWRVRIVYSEWGEAGQGPNKYTKQSTLRRFIQGGSSTGSEEEADVSNNSWTGIGWAVRTDPVRSD